MLGKKLIEAAAGAGGEVLGIEDVFSTWLYTGNGGTQTITNGIDLAGEGGMVWAKARGQAYNHALQDTARGTGQVLISNLVNGNVAVSDYIQSFNSNGWTTAGGGNINANGTTYASWTFRKAPGFFDVVTYTGTGSAQNISHNLGSVPGCIIVKRTDTSAPWAVAHRGTSNYSSGTDGLNLNTTDAVYSGNSGGWWNSTGPTSTQFSVGNYSETNASGGTYVAYLFAHDKQIFGEGGDQSVIKCGSYTGNGSTSGPTIDLGWEPQWLLIKSATGTGSWWMLDSMRGMVSGAIGDYELKTNSTDAEFGPYEHVAPTATGFKITTAYGELNTSGNNHIYIAIRRGPMKTPTSGTEVFYTSTTGVGSNVVAGFPIDTYVVEGRSGGVGMGPFWATRLLGKTNQLISSSTAAEASNGTTPFDSNTLITQNLVGTPANWCFRRAPGFFDVVAYTGTGVARTVNHNLGVAPELTIVKSRSNGTTNWAAAFFAGAIRGSLNAIGAFSAITSSDVFFPSSPGNTSTTLALGSNATVNGSGDTYIAYLFATCPGVSKVGSYTGTGNAINVDCGFTAGARFVLIKRTDSQSDWCCWDTARGIVVGNDPTLALNSTAAEYSTADFIAPLSSGFQIVAGAPTFNANGGTYIYLAIA